MTAFRTNEEPKGQNPSTRDITATYGAGGQLTVIVRPAHGGAVLSLTGELDTAVAAGIGSCVDAAIGDGLICLVLDLRCLTFCDCAGLSALLRARRLAIARRGWVKLAAPLPQLVRLIRTAGLLEVFPRYLSIDDAFNDVRAAKPDTVARASGR